MGAGTRDPSSVANVVRLLLGTVASDADGGRRLLALDANVDDLGPERVPDAIDALLAAGALDAWTTPIVMKGGRPAVTVSALCEPDALSEVGRRSSRRPRRSGSGSTRRGGPSSAAGRRGRSRRRRSEGQGEDRDPRWPGGQRQARARRRRRGRTQARTSGPFGPRAGLHPRAAPPRDVVRMSAPAAERAADGVERSSSGSKAASGDMASGRWWRSPWRRLLRGTGARRARDRPGEGGGRDRDLAELSAGRAAGGCADGVGPRRRAPVGGDPRSRARGVRAERRAALLPLQGGAVCGPRTDRPDRRPGHRGARGRERGRSRRVPAGDLGGRTRRHPEPAARHAVGKATVREIARALGLRVTEKPALACLSSRVELGIRVTPELLARIDRARGAWARSGSTSSGFVTGAGPRRSRCRPTRSIGSSSIARWAACSARSQRSAGTTCGSTRRAIGLAARSRAEYERSVR